MKTQIIQIVAGLLLSSLLLYCKQNDRHWQVSSPDSDLRVEITMNNISSERLYYSVYIKENGSYRQIMDPSPLGIEREDTRFLENLELVSAEANDNLKENYTLVTGKKLEISNSCNELTLTFRNQEKQKMKIIFRVFDHGIAFRYAFPGKSKTDVRVLREYTGFDFGDGNFWGHPYDTVTRWNPAYETYYSGPMDIGFEAPWNKNGWAFPILLESEGAWMLVSEAGFDGSYGASHLDADCTDGRYTIKFAESDEAMGYYENTSHASLPWETPWRFIAIGSTLHEIVETTLTTDLSESSKIDDPGWIRPGRASWSWWSDSDSPQDYERLVPFVDFASEMGWEYSLVDANWNRMINGDVERLASYAEEKGVGLLLWYNSGGKHNIVAEEPRDLMDSRKMRRAEFERISKLGIKGIKVDFFQSDKQEIIMQYLEILEDAAEFNLLVNCHGCTLPKGWRRTWPNLVSMESVRGGESYKFDSQFPEKAPSHLATLPYMRNAVGPTDYTPGGFSDHIYPHLTTYGFEMALPVVIESGIMHYMDTPERTTTLPGEAIQFLKEIPVVWDDTKYIAGYPGKDAVIARKKGSRWYIGGINGESFQKDITIDLSESDTVPTSIYLITDGKSERDLQCSEVELGEGKLTLHLEPYGGFAGYWE